MREKIRMVSTAGTGHFYTPMKNRRTPTKKPTLKKYVHNDSNEGQ